MLRIEQVLSGWEGTPYVRGWSMKGQGADCLRFVLTVIDELRGRAHDSVPRRGSSVAMHSASTSQRAMAQALRAYQPVSRVRPGADGVLEVQPGDVVVMGHRDRMRPAHTMMVGGLPNRIWHCSGHRVQWTGMSFPPPALPVLGAWRLGDLACWPC